jgi:hypothetical protein
MQIRTQVYCFVLFLAILLTASLVRSQVNSEGGAPEAPRADTNPTAYYTAVSNRFQVPAEQVRALVDAGMPAGEVVVLYFVAENSLKSADEILADREAGKPWRAIAQQAGLGPETFYYPLPQTGRKPFTNVYAVYHQLPRNQWSWDRVPLGDEDVRNLVNLRFLGEVAGPKAASDVLRLRSQGADFPAIHHFLLSGQQTASRGAAAEGAVRS